MRRSLLAVLLSATACTESSEPLRAEDAAAGASDAAPRDLGTSTPADSGVIGGQDATIENDAGLIEADAGAVDHRGICETSADCEGHACVRIPDDELGWYTCANYSPQPVKFCIPGELGCCSDLDCTKGQRGRCVNGPYWYCSGVPPPAQNDCFYDECQSDAECDEQAFGVCVPHNVYYEVGSRCSYGDCRYDSDCTSRAGGRCMPFFNPCHDRFSGFYCTYDDSGCRSDADCAPDYCAPGLDGASACMQFVPPS